MAKRQSGIAVGLSIIASLMILSCVFVYMLQLEIVRVSQKAVDDQYPLFVTVEKLCTGLDHSMLELSQYMSMSSEDKKAIARQRKKFDKHWEAVDQAKNNLRDLIKRDQSRANEEKFLDLEGNLVRLREASNDLWLSYYQRGNIPSYDLLIYEVKPKADQMRNSLDQILDIEGRLEATPKRKILFRQVSEILHVLADYLTSTESYLISGNQQFGQQAKQDLLAMKKMNAQIDQEQGMFTQTQLNSWKKYTEGLNKIEPMIGYVISQRAKPDWNVGAYQFTNFIMPMLENSEHILHEIEEKHMQAMKAGSVSVSKLSGSWTLVIMCFVALSVCGGMVIVYWIYRDITQSSDNQDQLADQPAMVGLQIGGTDDDEDDLIKDAEDLLDQEDDDEEDEFEVDDVDGFNDQCRAG